MKQIFKTIFLITILFLSFDNLARAGLLPGFTVDAMCDQSEMIVEGKYLGDNKVKILRIYKKSEHFKKNPKELEIDYFDKHSRLIYNGFMRKGTILKTNNVVLFLTYNEKINKWDSLYTIDKQDGCGSCGLFWYDNIACYGYIQIKNPGPYVLVSSKEIKGHRIPKNIKVLRSEIINGLINSRRWRSSLALENPSEKAKALAKYLLSSTSPKYDKGTYHYLVRDHLPQLKEHAVSVLIETLRKSQPKDDLNQIVLILYDIGYDAKPAVPFLCKLLNCPRQVYTGYVLSAIKTANDPIAIKDVRPFLKHKDFEIAATAAETLGALNDKESFESIVSLIPNILKKEEQDKILKLLDALYLLDKKRAKPIIKKISNDSALSDIKHLIKK